MKRLFCILFCFCCLGLNAQKKNADEHFRLYRYSEAIPLYKEYLQKKPKDYEASKSLLLAYKYTNNIQGAIEIARNILKLEETVAEDWYDMVQLLRISGNLAEARL
ncbi:MAG TPA: hypothetical protein DIW47_06740, partial [Bacteroidetes bacterium]|nr:hypothetical protein [Bacteroidota bacterium]